MWPWFKQSRDKLIKELKCSPEFAEGYLDGKMYRRHQLHMSERFKDGMNEYARGFRAGYYLYFCSSQDEVNREEPSALEA